MVKLEDLNPKITHGKIGLAEIAVAGLLKPVEEAVLGRTFIGDANILSAAVKGGVAVLGSQALPGFFGNVVGMSFGMDAIEDGLAVVGLGSKAQFAINANRNQEVAF